MNAGNNYDISKELIMPVEVFSIEPQYDAFHTVGHYGQDVNNCWLYNASLEKGDVQIISNKLVRNTADVSGIKESKTDTYNVFKMAYERSDLDGVLAQIEDPERRAKLEQALQNASETPVTTGYVNNTNTPIVLQQVRTTSSKSESFFDIGDYVPEREGYTFAGWCYKPSALYDSLIEDTSNYDWMNNTSGYDIQLYAKWAEETDEELEANGFRFDEATGELKIVNNKGISGWNKLCSSTNGECKAKLKSLFIGGDVTSVDRSLFSDCINLKSVVLSDTVKYINSCTFMNCSSLQTVKCRE